MSNYNRYVIPSDVLSKTQGEKLLVLNLNNDHIIELEGTAVEIWHLLEQKLAFNEIIHSLNHTWEILSDQEIEDIRSFLNGLVELSILESKK